jgi:hypothetical protein
MTLPERDGKLTLCESPFRDDRQDGKPLLLACEGKHETCPIADGWRKRGVFYCARCGATFNYRAEAQGADTGWVNEETEDGQVRRVRRDGVGGTPAHDVFHGGLIPLWRDGKSFVGRCGCRAGQQFRRFGDAPPLTDCHEVQTLKMIRQGWKDAAS